MKLVFIAPCVNEDFFIPVKQAAQDAAHFLDVTVDFIGTEDVDINAQLELLYDAAKSYDGIALSVPHPTAFRTAIAAITGHGIPLVTFNIDDPQSSRMSSICQNLYQAGVSFGKRAQKRIAQGASVLITQHSGGISALDERMLGMLDVLKSKDVKPHTLVTGTLAHPAADLIVSYLACEPQISAILCTGQADTEGAGLAAARLASSKSFYVAGFDVSSLIMHLIQQGKIDFTIDQQPYAQGFYPVVQLALYLREGVYPIGMDTGARFIDCHSFDNPRTEGH